LSSPPRAERGGAGSVLTTARLSLVGGSTSRRPQARRAPAGPRSLAALAGVILVAASLVAGCGGNGSGGGKLTAKKATANLKRAGYEVDKVTDGANKAIGPDGKLNADVYLGIGHDPDGKRLYVGAYFFSDPAARTAYATWARVDHVTGKRREVEPVVEGEGVFTSAGELQDELGQVVAAARGG
jgi:hypothetical protein